MKTLVVVALVGLLGLGAPVWWVLESSGVAIVRTRTAEGETRSTHVWYVRADDAIWLEAGRPEHPWYLDIQIDPRIVFDAEGASGEFESATVPGRAAHDHVRELLREKYGVRDRILGWVIDTSPSIAVRLTPVGEGGEPEVER